VAVSHIKSNTVADWTGTVTVGNSTGGTATIAATDLVRPADWNSAHNQWVTISGAATAGTANGSGTNLVYGGSNSMTINLSTAAGGGQTLWLQPAMSVLTAGAGISLSSNGSTISIIAPDTPQSEYRPYDQVVQQAGQHGQSTMHVWPVDVHEPVTCNYLGLPLIYSAASNSSNSQSISLTFALYTRNSQSFGVAHSTQYTTAMSASGSVGTNGAAFVGNRELRIPWSTSLSEGRYYQVFLSKTASNAGGVSISNVWASNWASAYSGAFGVASNATNQWYEAGGILSAQTAAIPNTFNASDLVGSTSVQQRPQIWRMMWVTY
jgi:hypothetical protein